jgi:hypothetical protein
MASIMRAFHVFMLVGVITHSGLAAAPADSPWLHTPDVAWMDSGTLPSVTSSAKFIHDEQIQVVGEAPSPTSLSGAASADDCELCSFHSGSYAPRWSVSAGAIFLHRSRPDSAAIATPPTGTPGVVINGTDFGFDWNVGPDLTLMHRSASGLIWEGRYFGDYDADASTTIPNITTFRAAGIGITILGGGSINSFYDTKLNSSEINVHKPITDRITVLGGFRWVEVEDKLRLNVATPATFLSWEEQNRMYGGQLGTNLAFTDAANPFRLNLSAKAGAYGNVIDNRMTSTIVSSASDEATELAFVGEVNLSANYNLTDHIAIRGGYQVMWLDNVSLASDAAAITTQGPGGTSSPVSESALFYNGATAAIEFMW